MTRPTNDDDRVWLGRARHAILTGRFGDAEAWLGRCLDRRPDDPAVWRACLDLAVATEDGPRFWEAAGRIPAEGAPPWEIAALRSWLAARSGDRRAERRESTRLVELQPLPLAGPGASGRAGTGSRGSRRRPSASSGARPRSTAPRIASTSSSCARSTSGRMPANSPGLSAVLGRPFDQHAWSLVAATSSAQTQPSPGTSSTRPPGRIRTLSSPGPFVAPSRMRRWRGSSRSRGNRALAGVGAAGRPACGPARRLGPRERPDDDHARARAGDPSTASFCR